MKINLIKNYKLLTYRLSDSAIENNIWLTEIDNNGIEKNILNVERVDDNQYKVLSNNDYYIVQDSGKLDNTLINESSIIEINHTYSYSKLLLLTSPDYDKMTYYNCNKELDLGITIGKSQDSFIVYNNNYISDKTAIIKIQKDKIYIKDLDSIYGIYINNKLVSGVQEIKFGDEIYISGLKLIFMKINGDYLVGISDTYNEVQTYMTSVSIDSKNETFIEESEDEKEMELYKKEDYFYRKPRYIYQIVKPTIQIDSPPTKPEKNEMPVILTVGPMLTMSLTSVMTFYMTMNNINSGSTTVQKAMPQLVMSGAMMLSFLLWPLLTNAFNKHLDKKKEKLRIKKYSEYIDSIKEKIKVEKANQEDIYRKKYLSLDLCEKIIYEKEDRLWERRVDDEDYLSVSLGIGNLPLNIDIKYPEEHFSMSEDNLKNKVRDLQNTTNIIENVPIPFSFRDNYISAIIGNKIKQHQLLNNLLLQFITFHSYENLKICVFTTRDDKKEYDDIRLLPHMWSNDKNVRFFASNEREYKEMAYQLDKIYSQRVEFEEKNNSDAKYNNLFLIIVDSINSVRNLELFNNIINNKKYIGFSIIILNDRISNIPDQCQTFIDLSKDECTVSKNISNSGIQNFKIDEYKTNLFNCVQKLCNIPLELRNEGEGAIPKKVGFLEMYNLSKIEQFNSKARWKENSPIMSMNALVGIGNNDEKISLDLHEKFHGPHGLIAGMTGSGKSEFIITYILSLAVNYHPYEVQFILIDYKGGGLAGAFENQTTGLKLPHLVGVITNLDKNEINRSLASIESELKRRQALFNKAREMSEESTIDIYKYQEMYRKGMVSEPVSHLLIIADEFAELKQQQPEFMEQLISTARIGRSLGVHLILATQKPSGVVDSQIWSNTRFRVCLRVQEKGDSTEVIKRPDAAYLTQTGRFYLQVGFNELFVLGQSAWTGGKYIPSDKINKNIDTSVDFVDNVGYKYKTIQTVKEKKTDINYGEELINIVKYLSNIAKEENIQTRQLWLNRIPEFILVTDLISKYSYKKQNYIINPIIGEYDVPTMQEQRLLTVPFSNKGNVLVYGVAGSGKENFITTMIFSSMITYSPQEVNYYIMDFGSESLKYLLDSSIVGDIVYSSEEEKIGNLFKMIQKEIDDRKKLFSNYNGDYMTYLKKSGKSLPNIIVVLNNYEAFQETYPDYEELISVVTRDSIKYGIYFVLTVNTSNGIRFKIKQNFGQIFALNQNSDDDYSTIFGNNKKITPSKIFGRGLINLDNIYEFQTAFAYTKEKIPEYIRGISAQINKRYNYKSKRIPILPDVVSLFDINQTIDKDSIIMGIDKEDLSLCTYDFTKQKMNLITGLDSNLFENVINPIVYQLINKNIYKNIIINAEDMLFDSVIKEKTAYLEKDFDLAFESLIKIRNNLDAKYNSGTFDGSKEQKINCIIVGLNSFKSKLSSDNQSKFDEIFKDSYGLKVLNYIVLDTIDNVKKYIYDSWYKDSYNNLNGIYLGNGILDQVVISFNKRIPSMKEEVPSNFAFVIKKGTPYYVKLVEKYKD